MTIEKPAVRPHNPHFSSGPCAKIPGWAPGELGSALTGRSHRSAEGKARLKHAIDVDPRGPGSARRAISSPSCRRPIRAPSRWRCGRCSAPAASTCWPGRALARAGSTTSRSSSSSPMRASSRRPMANFPIWPQVDFCHDVVFTWNGTTSGVRVPDAILDRRRPARASPSATRPRPPLPSGSISPSSMS